MCALVEIFEEPSSSDRLSLADIVREETGDGRLIVRFLVSAMQGDLEDATPSHRLSAARILVSIGFDDAQDFIERESRTSRPHSSQRNQYSNGSTPTAPSLELATIVRQDTDGGRAAVRFLVDVMLGNESGFKPHHRLSAAKELLRRGFSDDAAHADSRQGSHSDSQQESPLEPEPEVPVGFKINPDGRVAPDIFHHNYVICPVESMFGEKGYRDWLRGKKEEGRTILKPGWWQEGLEEFVDEDALTLPEAVLEAAEAQDMTVPPHLLEDASQKSATAPEAGPPYKSGSAPEDGPLQELAPAPEDASLQELEPVPCEPVPDENSLIQERGAVPENGPPPEIRPVPEEDGPPTELGPAPEAGQETSRRQPLDCPQPAAEEDTRVPWSKRGYFFQDQLSKTELRILEKGGVLHWDSIAHRFP